jgi:hypothetical protein
MDVTLKPIEGGYRVRATDEYLVDVMLMMFNWRVVVTLPEEEGTFHLHGFCYFGRTEESFQRAVAAALAWEDPLNGTPPGFDKQAY